MKTFLYDMYRREGAKDSRINPQPLEVEAKDMGHAMQKIAAALADDCFSVSVWEKRG